MKPKKLKNGKYQLRIYDYTDVDGKQHLKQFTAWSRQECIDLANEYKSKRKRGVDTSHDDMLFKDACELYISNRSNISSPSTIKKYKYMQRNFALLDNIPLKRIDKQVVQNYINIISKDLSSKSVRDRYGFLRSILASYSSLELKGVVLPKKVKSNRYLPKNEEVVFLINATDDTKLKLAICLGAYGMMREGEISAFTKSDLNGNILHIHQNRVITSDNEYIIKSPKSEEGDRYIVLPDFVVDMINDMPEDTIGLNPNQISKRFGRLLEKTNIPHFRFHDLRHYCCSTYHDMGVSDSIIMQLGGWGDDKTMKQVYRHAIQSSLARQTENVNKYFETLNSTKLK